MTFLVFLFFRTLFKGHFFRPIWPFPLFFRTLLVSFSKTLLAFFFKFKPYWFKFDPLGHIRNIVTKHRKIQGSWSYFHRCTVVQEREKTPVLLNHSRRMITLHGLISVRHRGWLISYCQTILRNGKQDKYAFAAGINFLLQ